MHTGDPALNAGNGCILEAITGGGGGGGQTTNRGGPSRKILDFSNSKKWRAPHNLKNST